MIEPFNPHFKNKPKIFIKCCQIMRLTPLKTLKNLLVQALLFILKYALECF
ncbi:hypothetical protein HPHPA20_1167 [Helicobacter pylori Hp A-20]|nr:hypothetical protein HPHPA20_1167 [Helicobacter pylori Hp A-20]